MTSAPAPGTSAASSMRGDPVTAIAERYYSGSSARRSTAVTARGNNLLKSATTQGPGGLLPLLKFCDPHAFDYPYLKEALDRAGIASMLIEVEDRLPADGQLGRGSRRLSKCFNTVKNSGIESRDQR